MLIYYLPGTGLRLLYVLACLILMTLSAKSYCDSCLQVKKWRPRGVKELIQGHRANVWWNPEFKTRTSQCQTACVPAPQGCLPRSNPVSESGTSALVSSTCPCHSPQGKASEIIALGRQEILLFLQDDSHPRVLRTAVATLTWQDLILWEGAVCGDPRAPSTSRRAEKQMLTS